MTPARFTAAELRDAAHSRFTAASYHAAMCAKADALRQEGKPDLGHAVEEASRAAFYQMLDAAADEVEQVKREEG